ncbi:MAG TPA: hypothetical protein VGK74_05575 [Symbiobacteriaceae bacterium]|jgi:hypothetical protein
MRKISVRKFVMLLALVMLVVAALGAGSQLIGACEVSFPPLPPC